MGSSASFVRPLVLICLIGTVALTAYQYFVHGKFNWLPLLPVMIAAGVVFGFFGDAGKKDGGNAR